MSARDGLLDAAAAAVGSSTRREAGLAELDGLRRMDRVLALLLFGVIVAALLCVLMLGTTVFRTLAAERNLAADLRMASGLIPNSVHGMDQYDAVSTIQGPEGPALVLRESTDAGTYELRYYSYDGSIVQEYALEGTPASPDRAIAVVESGTFGFTVEDSLVTVTTDAGTFYIALRSDRAPAAGGE